MEARYTACARCGRGGCRIVCVELDKRLAAVARRNLAHFPQVDVATSAFQTWATHGAVFSMVFAATSWHWLEPTVRYAKAASVLQPGGALAFATDTCWPPCDAAAFQAGDTRR
jgi:SAM-dependent methyltransferase